MTTTGSIGSLIRKQAKPAVMIFFLLTVLVGILYPLVVTGIAQVAFPSQANGNLLVHNGQVAGAKDVGQPFSSPQYFWGRLSATSPVPYNAGASGGSNLGPNNPALVDQVKARVAALHTADPTNKNEIPVDLVTASGSGLDPDISVAAAYYQVPRIARERNLSESEISALVAANAEPREFWIFGEPRVNVLSLNLALDDLSKGKISVPPVSADFPANGHDLVFGMRFADWIQVLLFIGLVALLCIPLGAWLAKVYTGKPNIFSPVFDRIEQKILGWSGVDPAEEMDWKQFAAAVMVFAIPCIAVVFILELVQQYLPLNPAGLSAVPWDLSLNTAVSFATNTNWQAYVPEVTMSYLTQMAGLAVENFLSAAVGMAVLVALIYAFTRKSGTTIGNFWSLLVKSTLVLIPICLLLSLVFVSQGVPQTFSGPVTVPLLDPVKDSTGALVTTQTIPLGPVASQVAIKHLGTNGGGFYNANSAHPLENPTPFTNFVETFAIIIIPAGLCMMFGGMIGSRRKGVALLLAMSLIFLPLLGLAIWSEQGGNPAFAPLGIDQSPSALQSGGNMEGKEVRFGIVPSALFAVVTTVTSCGAVDAMHDSFMPLAGGVLLFDMQLGEVVFGGVGSGLYGMLVFAIIAMFIAGLMVGRTPELYGKKIEEREMKIATVIILIPIILILTFTSLAVLTAAGQAGVYNPGPHGFSEILYAFTSAAQNNGSAFAGLSANSLFYNLATAFCMFVGRYATIVLTLALAGSLVAKKIVPAGEGTLRDHRPLFIVWLVFVIIVVGALSFLPALSLGPVAEYLGMIGGVLHV
ncbi:potassium-transporting ATPase subunit KdpA [Methanoregula sp. UBA64]|jgi:potassium-transporting ATPase potassium-binding subunit|uniref:potassium-transporting ATPase subunit KdpA n=1 Tax=Methanoregula sp. UBA64 TaxID=1915554 RepID=UPI0025F713CD|nr:potassium-transporting ATPase subunit KdpA [Methanoregula sp. UBA64]